VATFGLIHGAWHGAWCWERLVGELERLGHHGIAMDLPCDDPEASFTTYADHVARALADVTRPLVLVGHSLGGVTLPLAAARVGADRQVYLAAILHPALDRPGGPSQHVPGRFKDLVRFSDGSHRWRSAALAREILYDRCPADDATWAFERLRTQHTARPWAAVPVPDPWPASPVSAIVCSGDRVVEPAWGRWAAREILGVEPVILDADHSPFLSRPAALATILDGLAGEGQSG
jgi:hypothetical protein